MKIAYDKYYQQENLFGNPHTVLIDFFKNASQKGKVLDLGCGQGRNAIPIAQLGFNVTGIDNSKVGIEQMNQIAKLENLPLNGIVTDIFEFNDFEKYNFILLDSMFHFTKKGSKKETAFIIKIISRIKKECLVIFCNQDTGKKIEALNKAIDSEKKLERLIDKKFEYVFVDKDTNHQSKSNYRLLIVRK